MNKRFAMPLAAGLVVAAAALQSVARQDHAEAPPVEHAVAILHPTEGSAVKGEVTFTKASGGLRVEARITGLTPGEHGFHIHEFGDASSPKGLSAGGHFNPRKAEHAGPGMKRHIGDLGNIEADAKGVAVYDKVDSQLMLHGETSILGRGLVVHEKADDLKTQPTGNAGGRLAVGVIGVGQTEAAKKAEAAKKK